MNNEKQRRSREDQAEAHRGYNRQRFVAELAPCGAGEWERRIDASVSSLLAFRRPAVVAIGAR
jgi:hypothetical protein